MTMTKLKSGLTIAWAAALAITVSGCEKAAEPTDAESVKSALKADEKNWLDEFKKGNLEAIAGHYADDAYFASSAGPAANGSTEIRQFFANGLTDKNFKVTLSSDKMDVAASGDLAYSRGHFSEQYTDPKTGKIMAQDGSFVSVYKKQDDGSWKMVEDFAVGDPTTLKEVPPGKPATRAKMVSFG
jgi:uncharacterized protein (TIGR02246 family)